MTKQTINLGTPDKGNGDPLRVAFTKVNDNFTELYNALGLGDGILNIGSFEFIDNTITTTDSSNIIIGQTVNITSNLTVDGDLIAIIDGGNAATWLYPN
jgi:acetyltransferase-like isoleucine patch superfamily enzyme